MYIIFMYMLRKLTGQYWICPKGANIAWDSVNFFTNDFSEDIGDLLFGVNKEPEPLNFSSPDCTTNGTLKKRWKALNGGRCLIKGGSNPFHQQPFNEVIALEIMEQLDIPHVPHTLIWHQGNPYSVCTDFINADTELVSAGQIMQAQKQSNNASAYQF